MVRPHYQVQVRGTWPSDPTPGARSRRLLILNACAPIQRRRKTGHHEIRARRALRLRKPRLPGQGTPAAYGPRFHMLGLLASRSDFRTRGVLTENTAPTDAMRTAYMLLT